VEKEIKHDYQCHDSMIGEDGVGRIYLEDLFIEATKHFCREIKVYDDDINIVWQGTLAELIEKLRGKVCKRYCPSSDKKG